MTDEKALTSNGVIPCHAANPTTWHRMDLHNGCQHCEIERLRAAMIRAYGIWSQFQGDTCMAANGMADVLNAALSGNSPAPETSTSIDMGPTGTVEGLRRYIFEQLGFLTDDDNRPVEALLRMAAKKLRPAVETSDHVFKPNAYRLCETCGQPEMNCTGSPPKASALRACIHDGHPCNMSDLCEECPLNGKGDGK